MAYVFTLCERMLSGIKRPPFQGPMTFLTRYIRMSSLAFLVAMKVDLKVTPRKSSWSERVKKP